MSENKIYTYLDYSKNKYIGSFFCNGVILKNNEVVDILKKQEEEIQRLKLIINGLNYALKNIRQIDVEIDLNECGDVE